MWTAISAAVALYFDKYKSQFLIIGLALMVIIGIGIFAWIDIARKEAMAVEIATQKLELKTLKAKTEMLAKDQAALVQATKVLNENLTKIRTEAAKRDKVNNTHDLQKIGAKHPRMLEQRINKATRDQLQRFEEISK